MCWGSEKTMRRIFPWSKEISTELHCSEMTGSVSDPGPFTEQTAPGQCLPPEEWHRLAARHPCECTWLGFPRAAVPKNRSPAGQQGTGCTTPVHNFVPHLLLLGVFVKTCFCPQVNKVPALRGSRRKNTNLKKQFPRQFWHISVAFEDGKLEQRDWSSLPHRDQIRSSLFTSFKFSSSNA